MSLTDTTAPGQNHAISFEIELGHAPAKVWRALTEPALVSRWLLPVKGLEAGPTPGTPFTLHTQPFPGWDGTVHCRILEAEAPRTLRYAWVVGDMVLETVVTFTLTPTAAGTHLSIVQAGFKPEQKQNFGGARYGWKMMGGKLIELLGELA